MPRKKQLNDEALDATNTQAVSEVIEVVVDWKKEKIDLWQKCPKHLGKFNQQKQWFVPATLVRAIMRATGIVVTNKEMEHKFLNGDNGVDIVMSARVTVDINWVPYSWYALSAMRYSAIAKSWFGQPWRIVSVAIKDALKQKYAFFEGDYADGNEAMEDVAEQQNVVDVLDDILWNTPKPEPKAEASVREEPKPTPQPKAPEKPTFTVEFFLKEIKDVWTVIDSRDAAMKVWQHLVQKFWLAEDKESKKLLIQALNESTVEPTPEEAPQEPTPKPVKEEPKPKKAEPKPVKEVAPELVKEEVKEEAKEEPKKELPTTPEAPKVESNENEYTSLIAKWASDNGVTQFTPQHLVNCIIAIAWETGAEKGSDKWNAIKQAVISFTN